MRVSTSEMFRTGLEAMQRKQVELARTQLQLSSGKRMLNPSDDPRGATHALQLRERIAAVDQFARNGNLAATRLQQEETVLQQAGNALQRVRELTVQAANATQSNESRRAIAIEIREINESLVDLANSRDANGEYLFAGFRSGSRPFVENASGQIEYQGDSGQRFVGLSSDRQIAVGDSGELFDAIPRGNGIFVATPDAANTGGAWVSATEVTDATLITPDTYTIEFTSATDYDVLDSTPAIIASGTYSDGQGIEFNGRRVELSGVPAAGDVVTVEPAGSQSVFSMLDDLATALETDWTTDAGGAQLNQSTGRALQNLDQGLSAFIDLRAKVGARLNAIDTQALVDEDNKLQLESTLSVIEDLDYAEAISRFSVQQAALQAAQQTYAQVGGLSLFDFIR